MLQSLAPLRSRWILLIALAWALLFLSEFSSLPISGHHAMAGGSAILHGLPSFAAFWLVMVAAMMLPSSLSALRTLSGSGSRKVTTVLAFLIPYFAAWLVFGCIAFAGYSGLNHLAHSWGWLHEHQWMVPATLLGIVGLFQLTPTKRGYLEECGAHTELLARYKSRTLGQALREGFVYARSELLCCWGLMLLMFVLGHGLLWMIVLTGVMLAERLLPRGETIGGAAGASLVASCTILVILGIW